MRINDRAPFTRGRVIDPSCPEANQLGFTDLDPVVLTVIPVLIDPGLPVRIRCCKGRARRLHHSPPLRSGALRFSASAAWTLEAVVA